MSDLGPCDVRAGQTLGPGDTCTIDVQFLPRSPGRVRVTLVILTDDPGSPYLVNITGEAV